MAPAIAAAIGFSAGTVAFSLATAAINIGLSYAANALLAPSKPSSPDVGDTPETRTQNYAGGETVDKFIFGEVETGGSAFMIQKYNGFIYYGIAITRQHKCESIEAIYLGDKLSTHADYSNVELSKFHIDFASSATFETQILRFDKDDVASVAGNVSLTVNGVAYAYYAAQNESYESVRDGLFDALSDTAEITFTKSGGDSGTTDALITMSRVDGGAWNIATSITQNIIPSILSSASGDDGTLQVATDVTLTISGNEYVYAARVGDSVTDIRDGLLSVAPSSEYLDIRAADGDDGGLSLCCRLIVERIAGSVDDWDLAVSVDLGVNPQSITANVNKVSGSAHSDYVHRILYSLGDDTEANATLVSELDFDDVPQRWTTAHVGQGVTWVVAIWPADWLKENLGQIPPIKVVLKGNSEVCDPRSGAAGYSTNAALCARYLAQKTYSLNDSQLPDAEWIAAANLCDESVPTLGGAQSRYTANGVVSTGMQPVDRLKLFADVMQAPFMQRGAEVLIRPAAYRAPLIELDENDLEGNVVATLHPSTTAVYSSIQGTFINPDQGFQAHDYPAVSVSDGLTEKVGNLSLPLVNDVEMAQRIAMLNLMLQANAAPVEIHIKLLPVHIPADSMIYFTYAPLGWVKKEFYVESRDDQFDKSAILVLLPRDASQYAWDAEDAVLVDGVGSQPVFEIRGELA